MEWSQSLEHIVHKGVADGIAGGGAAALVTGVMAIIRWTWIGFRSDLRAYIARREAKRTARTSKRAARREANTLTEYFAVKRKVDVHVSGQRAAIEPKLFETLRRYRTLGHCAASSKLEYG